MAFAAEMRHGVGHASTGTVPSERLSAIGARVARVGHECRVPLSLIAGSLDALEQYAAAVTRYVRASEASLVTDVELARAYREHQAGYAADNLSALVTICRNGADRLRFVVTQLAGYLRAGGSAVPSQPVDLAKVLREVLSLVQVGRPGGPRIVAQIPVLPAVVGSAEALGAAFTNLIANACEAAAAVPDPRVWVEATTGASGEMVGGAYVEVSIRDNGPGVPVVHRASIFEPFFSTKTHGAGLGLGLTIARDVIEWHGGRVALTDSIGTGAAFVVRLPAQR